MRLRMLFTAALLAATAATLPATATAQSNADVARLEAKRRSDPQNEPVLRSLGVAYYKLNRFADAQTVLKSAVTINPKDGVAQLYYGMSAEAQGDLATARSAYSSYVTYGRTRRVRGQLQARLAALSRKEIDAEAKAAVANEARISAQPSQPNVIAVMPLRFNGTDTTLQALERGMADLLVTDLSRSSQLTVVERDRLQALVDEIQLNSSGKVDSTTAVRSGKLLRAGRIVQGAMVQSGDRLDLTASVVDVPTSQVGNSLTEADKLEQLFSLEKRVALDLFGKLGVQLTPQERALVSQQPTHSLSAFLAYSRGLVAEDAGHLDEASRLFEEAQRLDPGFQAAIEHNVQVQQAQQGQSISTASISTNLQGTEQQEVTDAQNGTAAPNGPDTGPTIAGITEGINPSPFGIEQVPEKDPASSATGTDDPAAGTGSVTIIIRQP